MKQNFNGIKFSMIVFVMMHIYSISIIASAGVTAGRMATRYIPTIISSAGNQADSNTITSAPGYVMPKFHTPTISSTTLTTNKFTNFGEMNANIPKAMVMKYPTPPFTAKPINTPEPNSLEDIAKKVLSKEIPLPDHDEYHIYTDLLTDENIESFKNKFKDESDDFVSKLSDLWTIVKDKYDEIRNDSDEKAIPTADNNSASTAAPVIANHPIIVDHDEVIVHIKSVTEKIFDPNDQRPLSAYIADMKKLAESLNPTNGEDKIIIDAIDFLQKNQHRTSVWDTLFWTQAAQEQGLNKIPKSDALKSIPKTTMICTLTSKANLKS